MSRLLAPVLVLALLAVLAVGCRDRERAADVPQATASTAPERPDQIIGGNIVPKSHEVPPGRVAEVRRIFESGAMSYPIAVVSSSGVQTQFVRPNPVFVGENRFVVGAPPHVHAAIDETLSSLGSAPGAGSAAGVGSPTYELTYWIVEANAASETAVAKDLAELAPMFEKLNELGPRTFRLIERLGGRTRDGARAQLTGRIADVSQKIAASPEGLELELGLQLRGMPTDVKDRSPGVETTLVVHLDKPVVLGDSTLAAASDGAAKLLLYVVRARQVD